VASGNSLYLPRSLSQLHLVDIEIALRGVGALVLQQWAQLSVVAGWALSSLLRSAACECYREHPDMPRVASVGHVSVFYMT
jgi:hypothetical protein